MVGRLERKTKWYARKFLVGDRGFLYVQAGNEGLELGLVVGAFS